MTPLVLVHGFMGGSAQWHHQVNSLTGTYEIIAPDLPGFGKNNHLPVINSIGGFADWVIQALRDQGIDRYHLLGHSMGGMVVQEMARRDPQAVQKLILYGTGPVGVLPGRFETIAESKRRAQVDGPSATARRIAATWFLNREDDPAFSHCADIAEQSAADALPAGLDAMEAWSGEAALASTTQDTLVLWGDHDRTYDWSQPYKLWTEIPNSRLAVVPGCAHAVHLEKPGIFNALVDDFLRGA